VQRNSGTPYLHTSISARVQSDSGTPYLHPFFHSIPPRSHTLLHARPCAYPAPKNPIEIFVNLGSDGLIVRFDSYQPPRAPPKLPSTLVLMKLIVRFAPRPPHLQASRPPNLQASRPCYLQSMKRIQT
jgi:hypothetical protein